MRQVDRQPQINMLRGDDCRLAVYHVVMIIQIRVSHQCLDQRIADDMRKRHLTTMRALHMLINNRPVLEHEFDRHVPDRGGRGNLQRLIHVFGDGFIHALEGFLAGSR